jgi:hypothetical protein
MILDSFNLRVKDCVDSYRPKPSVFLRLLALLKAKR